LVITTNCWQLPANVRTAMTTLIPQNPDTLLSREKTADILTAAGYPVSAATLATKATRGGGPSYQLFGRKPLYRWGEALRWAQSKLSPPRVSASEQNTFVGPSK
jgi:hypothetical protein